MARELLEGVSWLSAVPDSDVIAHNCSSTGLRIRRHRPGDGLDKTRTLRRFTESRRRWVDTNTRSVLRSTISSLTLSFPCFAAVHTEGLIPCIRGWTKAFHPGASTDGSAQIREAHLEGGHTRCAPLSFAQYSKPNNLSRGTSKIVTIFAVHEMKKLPSDSFKPRLRC